jgi:hypothetical protein
MPTFKLNYFSIVLLGRQNPQILNHDFLINNHVIPINKQPFKSLIKNPAENKKPFTTYLSSPLVTALDYKWISLIVQENRFQIKDSKISIPSKSPIVLITQKYFGELLRYTPFQLGGLNFSGELKFKNKNDENSFDRRLGLNGDTFRTNLNIKGQIQFDSKIRFPLNNGKGQVDVAKHPKEQKKGVITFNFEFIYEDINSFMMKLDEADNFYDFFKEMLVKLRVEIKK